MEGKPLYEYARANIPLPRAIPSRKVSVSIKLLDFTPASTSPGDGGHGYRWPGKTLSEEEKNIFRRLTELVHDSQASSSATETPMPSIGAEFPETSPKTGLRPAAFKVRMTVSGGTYVRSIVHDLGVALGCGAHVVMLRRTRQGQFVLREEDVPHAFYVEEQSSPPGSTGKTEDDEEAMMNAGPSSSAGTKPEVKRGAPKSACIPWSVWEAALKERKDMLAEERREEEEMMASGMSPQAVKAKFSEEAMRERRMKRPEVQWEKEVLKKFVEVEVPVPGGHGHDR